MYFQKFTLSAFIFLKNFEVCRQSKNANFMTAIDSHGMGEKI